MGVRINDGTKTKRILLFILVSAGLIISAYLFYQHYLIINEANGKADICYRIFSKGCSRALASEIAIQLGLPLAGWGIIYYIMLLELLLLSFKDRNNADLPVLFFLLSLLGCADSITLLIMIFFDHALFCPFCVIIHGINLLLFFISAKFIYDAGVFSGPFKHLRAAFKEFFKPRAAVALMLPVIFLYIILQAILAPGKIVFDAKTFLKEYDKSPGQTISVDKDDPVLGPVTSPVGIIVFSDFECPACRNFSKVITELRKRYPDKFYVVFKNFPLGKECNPIFGDYDLHPKACDAARAAEAARLHGKFWQYHDLLFSVDLETTKETFLSLAEKAGLDKVPFESDRKSEVVMARLSKTIEQGKQLGIKGTPAVFANGHIVTDFRLLHMQVLLDHLLLSF